MLKPKTDKFQKSGLVYGYECPCGAKYVGETKRKLEVRIQDHNQKSRNTAVYSHIKTCQPFSDVYFETYGELPKFDPKKRDLKESRNRFNILKNCFSIIGSNLGNYYRRTDYEGIYITLNKPVLNEQVKHRNVKLIWDAGIWFEQLGARNHHSTLKNWTFRITFITHNITLKMTESVEIFVKQ